MGIIKDAVDNWYDRQNYFQQTLIQFFTSIIVLIAVTDLGGLVFSGFETDQARARHGAPHHRSLGRPGAAAWTDAHCAAVLRRGFAARPQRAPCASLSAASAPLGAAARRGVCDAAASRGRNLGCVASGAVPACGARNRLRTQP